ncbi:GNAT family N-acetyltransferase [Flavobacterium sp. GT3R68]|uniref:GNAT family N-acetyltransferase n=1 Tax=Flavobacterium sp. GT3R68 TaxID=2594437 RepID=UPI000F88D7F4|nr:GNAT family N-acetyltransferase [Flavobacterium sp. GT3R68]RTY89641.1 GNAT family N-acetyltransferase [Flavobacterium sp. GSN2]TRW89472.1 GNAT family N-acetyltransferase [Flavobacterium sp. GT3R68]
MKILFEPNEKYIQQITTWLFEESQSGLNSFIYNFNNSQFTNDNFICLIDDNDFCIGYISYSIIDKYAKIEVVVIKNNKKRNGFGKILLNELTVHLLNKNVVVMELFCEPSSSKKIWKKLGFKEFKEKENHKFLNSKDFKNPWLYKPLVPEVSSTKNHKLNSYIELWTISEHSASNYSPQYKWDLLTPNSTIIYPIDEEWKIKYVSEGNIIYEGMIKRFSKQKIAFGNFLIINN